VPQPQLGFGQRLTRRVKRLVAGKNHPDTGVDLQWMPAARYSHFWSQMPAFALPSYYDGRVRLNVVGREKRGMVAAHEYANVCRRIGDLIGDCRNLLNGKRIASEIYCPKQNPHEVGPSEADVYIVWEGAPLGLSHPHLGTIGPAPYHRTGGHTGKRGFLNIIGGDIPPGAHGVVSSFDVVPTIIELLGESCPRSVSGRSLVEQFLPVHSG